MQTYIIRAKLAHDRRTYRDIELSADTLLYDLAKAVLDSFSFGFDHLFGFGDNPQNFYTSKRKYELKTEDDFLDSFGQHNGDVEKTKINEVPFFKDIKDKMCFLFDYGDDWLFELELRGFDKEVKGVKYPKILSEKGKSPEQYPDYD